MLSFANSVPFNQINLTDETEGELDAKTQWTALSPEIKMKLFYNDLDSFIDYWLLNGEFAPEEESEILNEFILKFETKDNID